MIVSSRRRAESPFGRLLAMFRSNQERSGKILDEAAFRFEIKKERSRVDRRNAGDEFAVVFLDRLTSAAEIDVLLSDINERLRITDAVGWMGDRVALLLPETNREGASRVANEVAKVALIYDQRVDSEVLIYPWDDAISSGASEFDDQYRQSSDDDNDNDDDGNSVGKSEAASESNFEKSYDHQRQGSATALFSVCRPTPIWKRATDIACSVTGLLLLSPLLVMSAVAIKLTSPGPVFFKQKREGKDGEVFNIVKFRTMSNDAEALKDSLRHRSEQDGPAFKLANDPRVTKIGKYLRKTCIDELPQLFNVLAGQMSMVGPRPLPVGESVNCRIWQRKRLEVLPGITCIWQVHGGRNTKFDEWMRMDMEYLRRRSFSYDLKLIFETAFVAVMHKGSV